ncbi:GNAT family N-acetyltransferase [Jeotgalibacillus aurantiacus]|uniref:GNAT family N-acetyltransferase n=1 Tax=Jeotgalibacillus aurantiacus TaxID=2763266 RepID=UPI001D0B9C08|nr:GNAT family N-acetyltransferase [Jeotgalibacillus aurantiacus]
MKIETMKYIHLEQTDQLFSECLRDLLNREGLRHDQQLFDEEVGRLKRMARDSLEGEQIRFFAAFDGDSVVGTVALFEPGELMKCGLTPEPGRLEVGCVYIHPDHQRQGVAQSLLAFAEEELLRLGHDFYYLDAGFKSSQQYWVSRFGNADVLLRDHWGQGAHHMIWKRWLGGGEVRSFGCDGKVSVNEGIRGVE